MSEANKVIVNQWKGREEKKGEDEGGKQRMDNERFKPTCILVPFSLTVVIGMYVEK